MPERTKLKIALLWHMHQPFYLNPGSNRFMMPWVRLHGLKDYLDMPVLAARYNIKATFNLVPSLLDQIEMYCNGYTDRHLELSKIPARGLSPEDKKEILQSFFSANFSTMIEPYSRYRQLYRKKESCGSDIRLATEIFSTSEWRDLQVWSNLTWIDPAFRDENPVKELFRKGRDFSEDEKDLLLDYQIRLLKRIIPTYQQLYREKKIDISFSPYYHPILPLLIDTDVAREAITDIALPKKRFNHPDDALWHIQKSIDKFRALFKHNLSGMWPSEGAISEDAFKLIAGANIRWIATDEEILHYSLIKAGLEASKFSPHFSYALDGAPTTRLFFRNHDLSDKIGFVYSGWEPDRAVNDFIRNLKNIRESHENDLRDCIVPIILDGENAWEYFQDDGTAFLAGLYGALSDDDLIEVVSLSDAAESLKPKRLPSLFAGSWINHNFRIWIGHREDNQAWDVLSQTRNTLVNYERNNPDADPDIVAEAWEQVYVAEGSDWCWWYGDEHVSESNEQFDRLYRAHLSAVYNKLGVKPPAALLIPIHRGKLETLLSLPESLITPKLDGLLTHYYEWSGAGHYDCLKAGKAMHRADTIIRSIYFAFDHKSLYIRLDFGKDFDLVAGSKRQIVIDFKEIGSKAIQLGEAAHKDVGDFSFSFKQLLEVEIDRKALTNTGSGKVEFSVLLYSGNELMEKWPVDEPISFELPERDKEIFWHV